MKPTTEFHDAVQRRLGGHFATAQLAELMGVSISTASKALASLEALQIVTKVGRGKWVDPARVSRLALPEFLADAPAYVTAHTALYQCDLISQVPTAIHAATKVRGGTFATPYGPVILHRVASALFVGWETDKYAAKIATAEKALIDYFYFALTGDPNFGKLPEVEVPAGFSWARAHGFADLIANRSWRSYVHRRLERQEKECSLIASADSAEAT